MCNGYYAGIEFGGTKVVVLVADADSQIVARYRINTTTPEVTLAAVADVLEGYRPMQAIGIGAFGPVDINTRSASYGTILNTPKSGWQGVGLSDFFARHFCCPVRVDTDVNVAGMAEYTLGAARGLSTFCYVTVGTGIGGALLVNGEPVKGSFHPEMGHMALARVPGDEKFSVLCPYHDSCAEGLASGAAISHRWGSALNRFSEDHDAWRFEAEYLAQFFHNLMMVMAPECIVVGGGVASEVLLERVRSQLVKKLNGYIDGYASLESLKSYLRLPELGDRAGSIGAWLLALGNEQRLVVAKHDILENIA